MLEVSAQSCYHSGLLVKLAASSLPARGSHSGSKDISTTASTHWFGVWKTEESQSLNLTISFGNSQQPVSGTFTQEQDCETGRVEGMVFDVTSHILAPSPKHQGL